eukprot:6689139-Lingulodinium_polyedra.AAC.1
MASQGVKVTLFLLAMFPSRRLRRDLCLQRQSAGFADGGLSDPTRPRPNAIRGPMLMLRGGEFSWPKP